MQAALDRDEKSFYEQCTNYSKVKNKKSILKLIYCTSKSNKSWVENSNWVEDSVENN